MTCLLYCTPKGRVMERKGRVEGEVCRVSEDKNVGEAEEAKHAQINTHHNECFLGILWYTSFSLCPAQLDVVHSHASHCDGISLTKHLWAQIGPGCYICMMYPVTSSIHIFNCVVLYPETVLC